MNLDDVLGKLSGRHDEALATFERLARDLADDKEPPADLAGVLCAAGKSGTDLRTAVGLVLRRRQLRADLAGAGAAEAELATVATEEAAAGRRLEWAQKSYAAEAAALAERRKAAPRARGRAADAEAELRSTAPE